MDKGLHKKYGLLTAITMVVGTVMGSGVFFKSGRVLNATGGNLRLGILAWLAGGAIMIICANAFSMMAQRYEYVSGVVDYSEVTMGRSYGYAVGWFMAAIYYPSLVSILAWLTANYASVLMGFEATSGMTLALTAFLLVFSYAYNALSPVLAGKVQVSTTFIKMVPLALMAIFGTVVGLSNGMTVQNFTTVVQQVPAGQGFFTAVIATAFAYEGWIITTSINAELVDAKRNLPKALTIGTIIVMVTYILYYVGLAGTIPNADLMAGGEAGVRTAFETLFSKAGGTALFVFVIVSCFGTLNGLTLGCCRGFYALAVRGEGPDPVRFRQIDPSTNMPTNSAILGLMMSGFWLFYFYAANLSGVDLGMFSFDSSELPIVTLYGMYIPIFLSVMSKEKELPPFKRFVLPVLALLSSLFMVFAACYGYRIKVVGYLIVFTVFMLVGLALRRPGRVPAEQ